METLSEDEKTFLIVLCNDKIKDLEYALRTFPDADGDMARRLELAKKARNKLSVRLAE